MYTQPPVIIMAFSTCQRLVSSHLGMQVNIGLWQCLAEQAFIVVGLFPLVHTAACSSTA